MPQRVAFLRDRLACFGRARVFLAASETSLLETKAPQKP